MKTCHLVILLVGLVAACCCRAEDAKAGNKVISFTALGAKGALAIDRSQAWTQQNMHIETRKISVRVQGVADLDEAKKVVKPMVQADDLVLIAFADCGEKETRHVVVDVTNRLAVINATILQTDDAEKQARRLERQALRIAAATLKMKNCPNPRCCMFGYTNLLQLDQMGRNFCPPCMIKQTQTLPKTDAKTTRKFAPMRIPAPVPAPKPPPVVPAPK